MIPNPQTHFQGTVDVTKIQWATSIPYMGLSLLSHSLVLNQFKTLNNSEQLTWADHLCLFNIVFLLDQTVEDQSHCNTRSLFNQHLSIVVENIYHIYAYIYVKKDMEI